MGEHVPRMLPRALPTDGADDVTRRNKNLPRPKAAPASDRAPQIVRIVDRERPISTAVTDSVRAALVSARAPMAHYLCVTALSLAELQDESPSASTARELRLTMERISDLDGTARDAAEEARQAAQ